MEKRIVEICCGSYYDGLQAEMGGAWRIELNSALHLGGLTPSLAELVLLKENTKLTIISMVRPRAAGFCYQPEDFETMYKDCEILLKNGTDGIAFGCLNSDRTLHLEQMKQMIYQIKTLGGEAVCHRAFDCVPDPDEAIEQLIHLGFDRILTGGQKQKAPEGADLLLHLQKNYGDRIEILAGGGVNHTNAKQLMEKTGIHQVHSSCKTWLPDPTSTGNEVSYVYVSDAASPYGYNRYDVVSAELVEKLRNSVYRAPLD